MAIAEPTNPAVEISSAMPRDYFALLKPRVMSLVIFTALVGMLIAPISIGPALGTIAILCIAVGAGASGALNMWYDADIDAVMRRTVSRPIPGNRVSPGEALVFGLVLAGFSIVTLGLLTNWLAAGLLAFTIFFYSVIYTAWLKRSTPQNIVIGGAAGAFPPVIGWAAMTGSIGLEPLVLFTIIFLWTPPHFWALALFTADDYARAGVPMMPNVAGDRSTRKQILIYSVLLAVSGIAPWYLGMAGIGYVIFATVMGLNFIRLAWLVLQESSEGDNKAAKKLFGFSIIYLFALFAALLIENVLLRML
ncbi:MAG: heme o synthase [Pseudomonadota bacterium]